MYAEHMAEQLQYLNYRNLNFTVSFAMLYTATY